MSESGATTGTRRLPLTSLASSLPPWPRWARQPKERQYVIGNVLWGNNHSNFARIFTTLHTVLGLHFWNCFDHNCYVYLLRKKADQLLLDPILYSWNGRPFTLKRRGRRRTTRTLELFHSTASRYTYEAILLQLFVHGKSPSHLHAHSASCVLHKLKAASIGKE